jgi:peptidoglycan/xylan/chitin deacetylase (PgdA/CDA1 family)
MPFAASYDLTASTHRLLESLERHGAHATFFAVGALALERPELIKDISSAGHEIAVHGWRHEHLDRLTGPELAVFGQGLAEAETAIESVTGRRPGGFRAPYLLGPIFFDSAVYDLLADRGYRWTSNRELRHVIELLRPNRLKTDRPWRLAQSRSSTFTGIAAQPTAESLLDFARFSLLSTLSQSRPFTMLTFHDWIIAGGNRLSLFDQLLSSLHELGVQAVTVEECWPELTASAALPHDSFQLHERSTA